MQYGIYVANGAIWYGVIWYGVTTTTQEEARELDLKKMDLEAGIRDDKQTSEYFVVLQELDRTKESILGIIQRPENSLPYIQVSLGR